MPPPALTIFAPSNSALAALLAHLPIESGDKPELLTNSTALTALLSYHIVPVRSLRGGLECAANSCGQHRARCCAPPT